MRVVVRAPCRPVWCDAHTQVSSESLSASVVLAQDTVLQPFERTIIRAKRLVDKRLLYISKRFT